MKVIDGLMVGAWVMAATLMLAAGLVALLMKEKRK